MATEDRGPADRRRPKALSVDEWRELDKTLQTLVLTVAKKAKNPTFSPDQLAQWIIGRLQVLLRRQLDLGSIADALGKISVMWACRFCNVSREDDTITALINDVLAPHRDSLYFLFLLMIHRRITRYEFNLAMGWCGDEPDTEEGRKKVLEKVLAKYESRIEDGDPINPSVFIASDKWEVLREAICDWSVRSVELMREIRQRVDAKNPMTNRELCERLSVFPLVGEFHSWQMATDMFCMSNNGMIVLEDDFLWPGPGAKKGLEMFNVPKSAPPDQVRTLLEQVNKYLASTGLERYVPGSRSLDAPIIPLQINIIELEHTLCEFSKYVKFVRDGAPRNRRSTEWLAWQEAGRAQEEAGDGGAEEAQEEPRDNGSSQDGRDDESVTGTKRKPPQRDELYGVEESEESTGRLRKRVKREFFPFSPSKAEVKAKIKTELLSITVKQEPQDESDSEDTVYEVEAITNHGEDEGELLFQIKWARHRRRTWEPESNLDGCQALLKAYKKKHKI